MKKKSGNHGYLHGSILALLAVLLLAVIPSALVAHADDAAIDQINETIFAQQYTSYEEAYRSIAGAYEAGNWSNCDLGSWFINDDTIPELGVLLDKTTVVLYTFLDNQVVEMLRYTLNGPYLMAGNVEYMQYCDEVRIFEVFDGAKLTRETYMQVNKDGSITATGDVVEIDSTNKTAESSMAVYTLNGEEISYEHYYNKYDPTKYYVMVFEYSPASFCENVLGSDAAAADDGSGDGDSYEETETEAGPDQEQLDALYNQAYEDELNGLSAYIKKYASEESNDVISDEEAWEIGEDFDSSLMELGESAPEVADVVDDITTDMYGESWLRSYLIDAAVSDSETVSEVRQLAGYGFAKVINFMLTYSSSSSIQPDLFGLKKANQKYAILMTNGTVSDILSFYNDEGGYGTAVRAINERIENISQASYDSEKTTEEEFNAVVAGRTAALEQKKSEYEEAYREMRSSFLSMVTPAGQAWENFGDCRICVIVDEDNTVYSMFLVPDDNYNFGSSINEEGTFLITWGGHRIIMDKYGNLLYEWNNTDQVLYWGLTESNNTLRVTYTQDFDNGTVYVLDLITPDGEVIKEVYRTTSVLGEGSKLGFARYKKINDDLYVDTRTGELLTNKEYKAIKEARTTKVTDEWAEGKNARYLNENYVYSISEMAIYDTSGNLVSEATEAIQGGQGPAKIWYGEADNVYWVISNTSYLYALDENWERLFDPVLLRYDETGSINDDETMIKGGEGDQSSKYTKYGPLIDCEAAADEVIEKLRPYDPVPGRRVFQLDGTNGEVVLQMNYINPNQKEDYDSMKTGYWYFIMGGKDHTWYNLKTKERLQLEEYGDDVPVFYVYPPGDSEE